MIPGFITQDPYLLGKLCDLQTFAPTNIPVLLMGSTGSGKEALARGVHAIWQEVRAGQNGNRPFVPVNCAGIPSTLLESELFGHVKGAFTGAADTRKGLFEMAHRGTIFLDEIGDMPAELQPKILRVLQDQKVWPIGASQPKDCSVRVIAATNRSLVHRMKVHLFREDLYYRLAGYTFHIPDLDDRPGDAELIAINVDCQYAKQEFGDEGQGLGASALEYFRKALWPGNVRQLQYAVLRGRVRAGRGLMEAKHLTTTQVDAPAGQAKPVIPLQQVKDEHIIAALKACDGNITHAAKALGVSVRTMRLWRKELAKQGTII